MLSFNGNTPVWRSGPAASQTPQRGAERNRPFSIIGRGPDGFLTPLFLGLKANTNVLHSR